MTARSKKKHVKSNQITSGFATKCTHITTRSIVILVMYGRTSNSVVTSPVGIASWSLMHGVWLTWDTGTKLGYKKREKIYTRLSAKRDLISGDMEEAGCNEVWRNYKHGPNLECMSQSILGCSDSLRRMFRCFGDLHRKLTRPIMTPVCTWRSCNSTQPSVCLGWPHPRQGSRIAFPAGFGSVFEVDRHAKS